MKLLYSWLRELTGMELEPEELAEALTMRGTAIVSLERTAPRYVHMVAGRVLETRPLGHHLVLARVSVGRDVLEIACGAPNVRTGMNVAVALPGAVLPGGESIANRRIHDVDSAGMILSLAELGLSSDGGASGIYELPGTVEPGTPLAAVLELDDCVIEPEITFNRGDCLSHLGIAREIVAMGAGMLRPPTARAGNGTGEDGQRAFTIRIDSSEACPRYTARVIENVTIGPSPLPIARRLALLGSRLVNNVVDATNYALFETGQPLHAFDRDRLEGNEITVRFAGAGEELVTLDGVTRKLTREVQVIADRRGPVALAGIMGGRDSEINAATRTIVLESAEFDPVVTRRGARAVGLATEASHRFERGVDPAGVDAWGGRAAALIAEVSGGRVAPGAGRAGAPLPARREVALRASRANALLGLNLSADDMAQYLRALGMETSGSDPLRVAVPEWRRDVTAEIDLIEEIARSHGYNRLPLRSGVAKTVGRDESARSRLTEHVRALLPGLGFSEIVTVSLIDGDRAASWLAAISRGGVAAVRVSNPISEALSTLRPHLLPGMLASVATNLNRRRKDPRFFELGATFAPQAGDPRPEERWHLGIAMSGTSRGPAWDDPARPADYYDLRGLIEALHDLLGIAPPSFRPVSWPLFGERMGAEILFEGEPLGFMGELAAPVRDAWELRQATLVLEVDFDRLAAAAAGAVRKHHELPRHPALERDIAVIVDSDVPQEHVQQLMRDEAGELLEAIRLFDLYVGDPLPRGKKSLAYSLTLRSRERTLTEEEAQVIRERIARRVSSELGAALRE